MDRRVTETVGVLKDVCIIQNLKPANLKIILEVFCLSNIHKHQFGQSLFSRLQIENSLISLRFRPTFFYEAVMRCSLGDALFAKFCSGLRHGYAKSFSLLYLFFVAIVIQFQF